MCTIHNRALDVVTMALPPKDFSVLSPESWSDKPL